MSESLSNFLKKYLGIILFSCVFTVVHIVTHDGGFAEGADKLKIISDGFAIPGLLVTSYGLLNWVYDKGALDGILYGLNTVWLAVIPGGRGKMESYGDFVEKKNSTRNSNFLPFIIVGATFIVLAVLFTLLYNIKAK